MTMEIYRERMSKIQLSTYLHYAAGWVMRVWRQEKIDGDIAYMPGRTLPDGDITATISRFVSFPVSQLDLAKAVLALDRVNSVEVIDIAGFGEVLHKDWP